MKNIDHSGASEASANRLKYKKKEKNIKNKVMFF